VRRGRSGRFSEAALVEEGLDEGDDGALVVGRQLGGLAEAGEEARGAGARDVLAHGRDAQELVGRHLERGGEARKHGTGGLGVVGLVVGDDALRDAHGSAEGLLREAAPFAGIQRIVDPDGSVVTFEYSSFWPDRALAAYTDERGTRTALDWFGCGRTLFSATTPVPGAQTVQSIYRTPTTDGSCPNGPSIDRSLPDYVTDGPRLDLADVTRLWVDSLGAVTRAMNALGEVSRVEYGDRRFPALATRVVHANGFEQTTAYDARGHVAATTAWNPLGDGRNATTRYTWDPTWDAVTQVRAATGEITTIGLDANGLRQWQQTGGDAATRVGFTWVNGRIASMTEPSTASPGTATTTYGYDGQGNLNRIVSPIGFVSLVYRDGLGRDTLSITPVDSAEGMADASVAAYGQRARTTYDVMDRVIHQDTWVPGRPGTADPVADTVHVTTTYDAGGLRTGVSRWVTQDRNLIGTITDGWEYDALGRVTRQTGTSLHSFRYDPAGNVVWTDRGDSSVYDALNRRTQHLLPAKAFALDGPGQTYENPAGIPADVEQFSYDALGNMVQADNADARVHRGYYPNGALRADTLAIRGYLGSVFTPVPMRYTYDLSGRPTTFHHPLLSGGDDVVRYDYDADRGLLRQLTDPENHLFGYEYDVAGRVATLRAPNGHVEEYRYDRDGRLSSRAGAEVLRRDARGKLIARQSGGSLGNYTYTYAPLGALRTVDRDPGDPTYIREVHWPDAFGSDSRRERGYSRDPPVGGGGAHRSALL
jgi:YD repeat-containing protein